MRRVPRFEMRREPRPAQKAMGARDDELCIGESARSAPITIRCELRPGEPCDTSCVTIDLFALPSPVRFVAQLRQRFNPLSGPEANRIRIQ